MIKTVVVWVNGSIDEMLSFWEIPQNVRVDRKREDRIKISFANDDIESFYQLEQIVLKNDLSVTIKPLFQAHSFSEDELLQAELLSFTGPTDEHIEVIRSVQVDSSMIRLIRRSGDNELQRIFFPYGGPVIVREDIIDAIKKLGINKGAIITPSQLEGNGVNPAYNWFALTSTVDLGQPVLERRFIPAFPRERWNGEDICSSTIYVPGMLYISRELFQYLRSLSDYSQMQIDLQPVDLI